MMRSPEQQYNFAKSLPIPALEKVLEGQSDIVEPYVADMVLRQKTAALVAKKGAQAMQMAQSPKIVQKDLAAARQVMQPRMEQGVAALPADVAVPEYAGGGIVAFDDGGPVQHFQNQGFVGAPMQSTRVPGPGPTFASAFPDVAAAEKAAAEAAAQSGGRISFTAALKRIFGPAYALYELGAFHKRGMDYDTGMGFGTPEEQMTVGTISPSPRERPVDRVRTAPTASTAAAPETTVPASSADESAEPPVLPRRRTPAEGIETLVAPKIPIPKGLTVDEAIAQQRIFDKAYGVDPDVYKRMRERYEREVAGTAGEKTQAAWMRVLEAGLGTLGGESPYGFVNLGKGSQAAAKGAMEDIKEFRKLERDRQRALGDLDLAENAFKRTGSVEAQRRMDAAQERVDKATAKQADLEKDVLVTNAQLRSQALTRADTRELTIRAQAREAARKQVDSLLRRNLTLANDPKFDYDAAIEAAEAKILSSLGLTSLRPTDSAQPIAPRGTIVNGVYVPRKQAGQ